MVKVLVQVHLGSCLARRGGSLRDPRRPKVGQGRASPLRGDGPHEGRAATEMGLRIGYIFFSFVAAFAASYYYSEQILLDFAGPLGQLRPGGGFAAPLIYTKLTEAFFTYLRIAFFVSLFTTGPLVVYHCWLFISPGLYEGAEHDSAARSAVAVLLVGGFAAWFAFYVLCPLAWKFLLPDQRSGSQTLQAALRAHDYVSFVVQLCWSTTFSFLVPLFAIFLTQRGWISLSLWASARKEIWVGSFIVAAILSPPDVASQLLLALPMGAFYEVALASVCVLRSLDVGVGSTQRGSSNKGT
jgi:sec-independent protein translocase protein TatC